MATDNRHRPGPPFRCPEKFCHRYNPAVLAWAKEVRRSPTRRLVLVECPRCGRKWRSSHKDARSLMRLREKADATTP